MIRKRFKCRRCGCQFKRDVFEPGEAEDRGLGSGPVRCPECSSPEVEHC